MFALCSHKPYVCWFPPWGPSSGLDALFSRPLHSCFPRVRFPCHSRSFLHFSHFLVLVRPGEAISLLGKGLHPSMMLSPAGSDLKTGWTFTQSDRPESGWYRPGLGILSNSPSAKFPLLEPWREGFASWARCKLTIAFQASCADNMI